MMMWMVGVEVQGFFLVMLFIPSRFAGFLLHNSCKIRKLSFSDVIDSLTFLYLTCKHFPQVFNHHPLSRPTIKSMKKNTRKNPLNSMPYFFSDLVMGFQKSRNQQNGRIIIMLVNKEPQNITRIQNLHKKRKKFYKKTKIYYRHNKSKQNEKETLYKPYFSSS